MTSTLVTGIAELVTNDSSLDNGLLGVIPDAALVVIDGSIGWIGSSRSAPPADYRIDVGSRAVLPGFVDSHTHLVFAGDRAGEFTARMSGQPYDGGGIAATVAATRAASDTELTGLVAGRVAELRRQGTTTVEIKSGYGLTVADELRSVRAAAGFTSETTFLGAHIVPPDTLRADYVDLVATDMLTACAEYARWIDVFCEPASPHAFTADEARAVLAAGRNAGLGLRVHGNQLGPGPGVQLAVEFAAASVDHCTYLSDADIDALAGSSTVATLLPGVEFATRSPYPDAQRLWQRGVRIALATDCNPGTCYSSSMPFMIALAVNGMGLTAEQAVHAATAGGAAALRRDDVGTLAVGKAADLCVLDAPSYLHLAYRPGVPLARTLELARDGVGGSTPP